MNGQAIVDRTNLLGRQSVYWYGGKRQTPTKDLASALKKLYPTIWTNEYYEAALKDIGSGKMVTDCSGLVCGAYGISDIGTSQMPEYFYEYTGKSFLPGMIAWKKGHCGIIIDASGTIAEMRGLKWDFCTSRNFKDCGFTKILYDKNISYATLHGWMPIGSNWKYIKTDGYTATNEFLKINGSWYYFGSDSFMVTGYFRINNKRYCSTENGLLKSANVTSTELSAYELIH